MSSVSNIHSSSPSQPELEPVVASKKGSSIDVALDRKVDILARATIALMVAAAVAGIFVHIAFFAIPIAITLLAFIVPSDDNFSENTANKKAVNEYLNSPIPSTEAYNRITQNIKAAQQFIWNRGDLNKLDENGLHLALTQEWEVFKYFVDCGADLTRLNKNGNWPFFEMIVSRKDHRYLEYILRKGRATNKDFTEMQQAHLWSNIGSPKAGLLLYEYGFNVKSKDNKGRTALEICEERAKNPDPLDAIISPLDMHQRIATLKEIENKPVERSWFIENFLGEFPGEYPKAEKAAKK